jgi:FO synthase subunit 1
MQTVTYSRNVFISVTNLCSNRCDYCSFWRDAKHAKLIGRTEAVDLITRAAKAGCTEALFSMGERAWNVIGFEQLTADAGLAKTAKFDFMDYLIELCELALDWGLLPHTNCGLLLPEEMEKLAPYNASMGLMLETTAADVAAHQNSPGGRTEKRR